MWTKWKLIARKTGPAAGGSCNFVWFFGISDSYRELVWGSEPMWGQVGKCGLVEM